MHVRVFAQVLQLSLFVVCVNRNCYSTNFGTGIKKRQPVGYVSRPYTHVQRAVMPKKATILAYGDISSDEKDLFRKLVARNAANMNFESYEVRFTTETMLNDVVKDMVERWEKY